MGCIRLFVGLALLALGAMFLLMSLQSAPFGGGDVDGQGYWVLLGISLVLMLMGSVVGGVFKDD